MGLLGDLLRGSGENKPDEYVANLVERAEKGDIQAMEILGEMYMEGDRVGYNPKLACQWWTKAAEGGQVDAMFNLGQLYRGDYGNCFWDVQKSANWFYEAGVRGDMEAREELERSYRYSAILRRWVRL